MCYPSGMQIDGVTWTGRFVNVWVFDVPMVFEEPQYEVEAFVREHVSNIDGSVGWDWYPHGLVIRFERGYE